MKSLSATFLVLTFVAAAAAAQTQPVPGDGDPHLQTIDYSAGQIVQLRGSPGFQLMVELSPDEQVQSVALGDSAAWQVSVNKEADRLFLKPIQANAVTNMTVVTSVRVYAFDLFATATPTGDMPYTVQFRYPAPSPAVADSQYVDVSAAARRLSQYKVWGDRLLRPQSVTDDGQHTYVVWAKGSPIPAVYAPDRVGNEVLLNGMMATDDVYVVDGAPQRLVFRIDRAIARAERINSRKSR
jgi:type IV secretion system protein VirB9